MKASLRFSFWFLVVVAFGASSPSLAQDTLVPLHTRTYEAKFVLRNGKKMYGYLKKVTDSTIVYTDNKTPVGAPALASDKSVGYAELAKVRLLRKGAVGRGMLIGVVVGAAFGVVAGFAGGKDPESFLTSDENAAVFGVLGILPGALVGALIGHIGKTFHINGTKERLAALQQVVSEKVYGKPPLVPDP